MAKENFKRNCWNVEEKKATFSRNSYIQWSTNLSYSTDMICYISYSYLTRSYSEYTDDDLRWMASRAESHSDSGKTSNCITSQNSKWPADAQVRDRTITNLSHTSYLTPTDSFLII